MNLVFRPVQRTLRSALVLTLLVVTSSASFAQCPQETLRFTPSGGGSLSRFGAVAASGTTAVIGGDGLLGNGSAYLFDSVTGQQQVQLVASDGVTGDLFGVAVALSGPTVLVGASEHDANGMASGAAYLFDRTTGLQLAKLLPSDGAAGDRFGLKVAISGTTVVVGAEGANSPGLNSGAAYLFDTATGLQTAKLVPNDLAVDDGFGHSVAIVGTTAIVGSWRDDDNGQDSGSVYLFDTVSGLQLAKFLANDGAAGDRFGSSVAVSGTRLIVGARADDDFGLNSGSAYVFDIVSGFQLFKLLPSDGAPVDQFGDAVGISGTTVVVGARFDKDQGSESGSAYLFDTTTGVQITKLLPSDGAAHSHFGSSVAISGSVVLVGRPSEGSMSNHGSAYVFTSEDCNSNGVLDALDIAFATSFDCDFDRVPDECQIAANPTLDANGNGTLDSCELNAFASYCNGDGGDQLGCTDCPCSNNAAVGTVGGCLNSVSRSARLTASGDESVSLTVGSSSDLRFSLAGAPPTTFCVLDSAVALAPSNAMNPCFGLDSGVQSIAFDGLRCAIVNPRRHGGRFSDSCGEVGATNDPWGGEGGPPAGIAQAGAGFVAGQTRYFQVVYREDTALSCMRGLNTSQAIEVVFTP